MTPDEHDNPETYEEPATTEVHRFSAAGFGAAGGRAAGDTLPDVPAMEQLPDPDALPDPGFPEMPAPVRPARPPVPYRQPAPDRPPPPEAHRQPDAHRQVWSPDPYAAPRAPDDAPPLRGPSVPWSQVRAAADYEAVAEPLAAPPTLRPHPPAPRGTPTPAAPTGQAPANPWTSLPGGARGASAAAADEAGPSPDQLAQRPTSHSLTSDPLTSDPLTSDPLTSDSLTSDLLLPGKRATPDGGWRRTVYRATGGLVRVGESSASMRRRDLISRIRTPVTGGHHRVAVLSLKGGVGKTTATVGLGATLASLRGDRVIAVDGNPDRGTLSDKVRLETPATIRDLLNDRALVARYADVRSFTTQAPSRLEILASDRDPGVSVAFSADDYRAVASVLEHYYSVCITDCGTGLLHSAMAGILELADQVVLVSSPSVDGARSASATLDWLDAHSYGDLVRGGVVVLSAVRRKSKSAVDLDRLEQHFAARCRAVVRVPYDTHLEEGAEFELGYLDTETAEAYLTLAALVADGFALPRRSAAGAA
jgi:MinD-like ATPase involved in chromosome partitioning or flagellar assembly